jgi:hypothetical protein
VPVGAYEDQARLVLHFGPEYTLRLPAGLSTNEIDCQAARLLMQNIAKQMPLHLRGEFDQE